MNIFQTRSATCAIFVAAFAASLPAHAGARIGWVWAGNDTTASYTADSTYSYNSQFGANTITRSATGTYQVQMAGLYAHTESSNVQVTAYGGTAYCMVAGWTHSGSTVVVNVGCYNAIGAAADSKFTALYLSHINNTGDASRGLAFVWNPAAGSSSTPPSAYSYNSTGGTNTITHEDTGSYTVTMPGLTKIGGDIQVTAYGSTAAHCKVLNWGYDGSGDTTANVLCFNSAGTAADSEFTLSYSLLDPLGEGTAPTNYQAYVWADKPDNHHTYSPDAHYNYNNFKTGHLTSVKTGSGRGTYTVTIPGSLPPFSTSNVLVTAFGSDPNYCNIVDWGTNTIDISCSNPTGAGTDENFDVSFQAWE